MNFAVSEIAAQLM